MEYATRAEAIVGHARAVALVRAGDSPEGRKE